MTGYTPTHDNAGRPPGRKEHTLIIDGKLMGLNEYTRANRANRMKGAQMKINQEAKIRLFIRKGLRGLRITKPVFIEYRWIEENKKRDLYNIAFAKKFINDSLVKEGILQNDGWNNLSGFRDFFEVDKGKPRIEVKIIETT